MDAGALPAMFFGQLAVLGYGHGPTRMGFESSVQLVMDRGGVAAGATVKSTTSVCATEWIVKVQVTLSGPPPCRMSCGIGVANVQLGATPAASALLADPPLVTAKIAMAANATNAAARIANLRYAMSSSCSIIPLRALSYALAETHVNCDFCYRPARLAQNKAEIPIAASAPRRMIVKFRNEAACPRPLPVAGTLTGATAELEGRGEGCTVVAGAAAGVVAAAGATAVTDGTAEVVATGGVVAAIVEVGADAAAAWIAPVPKLAGIDVPLGPDNEPEIVSAETPFAIAVNDACRSATGATVETPDLAALTAWLDWAFADAKAALVSAS